MPASPNIAQAVAACQACPDFLAALQDIYTELDGQIAQLGLACRGCGHCCDFAAAGHRLYVSSGELARLILTPPPVAALAPLRCPYQQGSQCLARPGRALGCRTYFCQAGSDEASTALYERYHAAIRRLHEQLGLPYLYVELTGALAQLPGA